MKNLIPVAAIAALISISGCAVPSNSASVYRSSQAQGEQIIRTGVVESVRNVTIDKGDGSNTAGTLVGGALGGIAGSKIGKGRGAAAAAIGSAVLGGVIGNQIQDRVNKKAGLEITVILDRTGEMRAITQDADEAFRPGERVRLLTSGGVTRVTH